MPSILKCVHHVPEHPSTMCPVYTVGAWGYPSDYFPSHSPLVRENRIQEVSLEALRLSDCARYILA